jgi:hypothetical protein
MLPFFMLIHKSKPKFEPDQKKIPEERYTKYRQGE